MDKHELLVHMRTERARWDELLAEVGQSDMLEPGLSGGWSVKDLVAHITWFEREMVKMLRARSVAGSSQLWELPTDERNRVLYEQNHTRPLTEVLEESPQVHEELVEALQDVSDEELQDARYFEGMPAEWVPWRIVAENSHLHYQDHYEDVRRWLAAGGGDE